MMNKSISYQDLKQLLIDFNPNFAIMMEHHIYIPQILTIAAEECFVNEYPETDTIKMIRHQLKYLKKYGKLDITGGPYG